MLFLSLINFPRSMAWILHVVSGAMKNIAMLMKNIACFTSVYLLHVLPPSISLVSADFA